MTEEATRQLLGETLEKLRKRIKQIRSKGESIGEENTKAVLINPLLSALGWNLEDLDEVCQEYKRRPKDNPVDYALFILRSPQLLIEAKDFGRDLNDLKWISQTLGYATVVGVEWCVLTNGDEYRIYNSHVAVPVEEKLFRIVEISDPSQDEYALDTLDLLSKNKLGDNLIRIFWKAHFVDRHVDHALRGLFRGEERGLVNLIRKKTPELKPSEIRESLKRANIQIDFPVIPVTQPPKSRKDKKPPKRLEVKISDLIKANLIQAPLELEREFKGVRHNATIQQDGSVFFNGEQFTSLSTAGRKVRNLATNGWTFWQYYDSGTGKMEEVDVLRRRYLKTIGK
jgi:hypothetical protein